MISSANVFSRIAELGLTLPAKPAPNGLYDLVQTHNGFAFVSGQLPRTGTGPDELMKGRLRTDRDIPLAQQAARLCFVRALLALDEHLGDLAAIDRLVSIRGFLNAVPEFEGHPRVLDAVSALARDLFGDRGGHVRSALGAGSLPSGGIVELELVVGLRA